MPSRSQHIERAQRNEQVAQLLLESGHADWAVTLLFYAAIHWVDAVLDGLDGTRDHPRNHAQRRAAVARRPQLAVIYRQYRSFYDTSVVARYDCVEFLPDDVEKALQDWLQPVRSTCRRLLGL